MGKQGDEEMESAAAGQEDAGEVIAVAGTGESEVVLVEEGELRECEARGASVESVDEGPGQEVGEDARHQGVEEELEEDEEREEDGQAGSEEEHAKREEDEDPETLKIEEHHMEEEMYTARDEGEQSEIDEELPRSTAEAEQSDVEEEQQLHREEDEQSAIEVAEDPRREEGEQAEIEEEERLHRDLGQQHEIEEEKPPREESDKTPDVLLRYDPGRADPEEREKQRPSDAAGPSPRAERLGVKRTPRRKVEKVKGTVARANELDYLGLDPKLLERGEITVYQEVFQSFTDIFSWAQSADAAQKERFLREALQVFTQFCNIIGAPADSISLISAARRISREPVCHQAAGGALYAKRHAPSTHRDLTHRVEFVALAVSCKVLAQKTGPEREKDMER